MSRWFLAFGVEDRNWNYETEVDRSLRLNQPVRLKKEKTPGASVEGIFKGAEVAVAGIDGFEKVGYAIALPDGTRELCTRMEFDPR